MVLNGGQNNVVSRLTIRDNVGPDDYDTAELGDGLLLMDSAANTIVDNVITHNGIFDGIGVLGELADDNVIMRNTVEGTVGPGDGARPARASSSTAPVSCSTATRRRCSSPAPSSRATSFGATGRRGSPTSTASTPASWGTR